MEAMVPKSVIMPEKTSIWNGESVTCLVLLSIIENKIPNLDIKS